MPGYDKVAGVNDDHEFPPPVKAAIQAELVVRSDSDIAVIYGRADDEEVMIPYTPLALDGTLAQRAEDGTLSAADPTDPEHLVTKAYADALIPPFIVIEDGDPIPEGTPAGMLIFRSAPAP